MNEIQNLKLVGRALEINWKDGKKIVLEDCWLRDNCRCSTCYHADTFQRAIHLLAIPETRITSVDNDTTEVVVKWDDGHISKYKLDFLARFYYQSWAENRRLKPILWRGDEVADKVVRVQVDDFLNSMDGAKAVLQSLLDHGVALITNVEASVEATEKVCKALGGVQHTLFGGMWEFTTKPEHADTAYTNLPLAVHNDNTYFTEAAGFAVREVYSSFWLNFHAENLEYKVPVTQTSYLIHLKTKNLLQILHCVKHTNGTGGNTILADGFYGASRLRDEFPEDFKFLSNFDVEAEYLEDGHHHKYSAPVILVDKAGDMKQIRFNVYDRSAMAFASAEECRSYYRSLRNLSRYYENPENQWQFKLKPGTVMAMDNFRVLHGRTAFTGNRVLCGSYVARSDWLDKARSLGLIQ